MLTGPTVATCLDPRGRLAHQLTCFRRWRELGIVCRSFNSTEERVLLRRTGLGEDEVVAVGDDETVATPAGRASPRLLAVLRRMHAAGAAPLLLVQPDLFAAVPRDPLPLLSAQGDALGLVRSDCLAIDQPADAPRTPWHGGLDAFSFSATGVEMVLGRLSRYAASDGLALDVPGSDLLLGDAVLAEGGDLIEAPFLLHPRHLDLPVGVDTFAPMAQVMFASGRYSSRTPGALADEFARLIAARCTANASRSRLLSHAAGAMFAAPPQPAAAMPGVVSRLARQLPGADVAELLLRQLSRPDWPALHLMYRRLEPSVTPIEAYLRALRVALQLRIAAGQGRWTATVPVGEHADWLRAQMALADANLRRQGILALFATEFHERGVLDTNLFKYLLTQCTHESEQRLCAQLLRDFQQAAHAHDEPTAAA